MKVRNHRGKTVLEVKTKKNVKRQGLTEAPFARFPEGEYKFRGTSIGGDPRIHDGPSIRR